MNLATETRKLKPETSSFPPLAISRGFGLFSPEIETMARQAAAPSANPAMKAIGRIWKKANRYRREENFLRAAEQLLAPTRFTPAEIERFSLHIGNFKGERGFAERAGMFLSMLINAGNGRDYVIHTDHLDRPGRICFGNTKRVLVKGDVGDDCCAGMEGGAVIIEGSAGSGLGGFMKKGRLTVNGNVGEKCGHGLDGGIIVVEGDAGDHLAFDAYHGRIIINGNAGSYCGNSNHDARVIVKGNAGDSLCHLMRGGSVLVEGDAGLKCGDRMRGGRLHVKGAIAELAGKKNLYDEDGYAGGKIFHIGVQVWPLSWQYWRGGK